MVRLPRGAQKFGKPAERQGSIAFSRFTRRVLGQQETNVSQEGGRNSSRSPLTCSSDLSLLGAMELSTKLKQMEDPKILVIDDKEQVRRSLKRTLEYSQFQIVAAANVDEGLRLIDMEPFDVLLSDWHLTEAGNGFAAVSAMHNKNPYALTLVYTGYSELKQALNFILFESDEVLEKQMFVPRIPEPFYEKVNSRDTQRASCMGQVATILECNVFMTMMDWLDRVEHDDKLTCVSLSAEERTGQYAKLIGELAHHLRSPRKSGREAVSGAAAAQGALRHSQGYTVAMILKEMHIFEVSLFETLYSHMDLEDFRFVLSNSQAITGECDLQVKQTLASFTRQRAKSAA